MKTQTKKYAMYAGLIVAGVAIGRYVIPKQSAVSTAMSARYNYGWSEAYTEPYSPMGAGNELIQID